MVEVVDEIVETKKAASIGLLTALLNKFDLRLFVQAKRLRRTQPATGGGLPFKDVQLVD